MIIYAPDQKKVQAGSHRVLPRVFIRSPDGSSGWVPLMVLDGTVTLAAPGVIPNRSLSCTVLIDDQNGDNILAEDYLSPYGSWLKVDQQVFRNDGQGPGGMGSSFVAPLGFFRVDEFSVNYVNGQIAISGSDFAGSQLAGHGLQSLREHQANTTDTWSARLISAVQTAATPITPFWSTLVNLGGASTTKKPVRAWVAQNDDRLLMVQDIAAALGKKVVTPAGGALLTLMVEKTPGASEVANDVVVKAGSFGNLLSEGYSDNITRSDMFNSVHVLYTREVALPGARTRVEQRRLIVDYTDLPDDLDYDIRTTSPFGKVTREAVTADVITDADAQAKGKAAIIDSRVQARDISLQSAPIYGLESGDTAWIVPPNMVGFSGRVIGATIPIMPGPWSLIIRSYRTLDKSWKATYRAPTNDSQKIDDRVDWQPFAPRIRTALDGGFFTGWAVDGNNAAKGKTVGGDTMMATAVGGQNVLFRTGYNWSDSNAEHRYRISASCRCDNRYSGVTVGVDYTPGGTIWGKRVGIAAKKSRTVSVDATIPAAATSFRILIQFDGPSNGAPSAGAVFKVYSVSVEKGARQK